MFVTQDNPGLSTKGHQQRHGNRKIPILLSTFFFTYDISGKMSQRIIKKCLIVDNRITKYFYTLLLVLSVFYARGQNAISSYLPFKYALTDREILPEQDRQQASIDEIISLQKELTEEDIENVRFWNAAYPSYRWHQKLMEASELHTGHKNGGRVVIMHLTIYDAMVEVWKYKSRFELKSPFQAEPKIKKLARQREYSSFICEYSAAAGAAHTIITHYFPEQQARLDSLLQQFKIARLSTGLQYPSDIARGLEIGREIGEKYISYAKTDFTDRQWEGNVPSSPGLWTGDPGKWDPMKGQWKPLTLEKPDQFRPEPPRNDWSADMEELNEFNASHQSSDIAWKWKSEPIWDKLIEERILAYDLAPLAAAHANALFHTARFDAIIGAWEAKYYYWGIRPFQYDPNFKPILVDTPNFPGYPAGHSTVAGSLSAVLAHLFPGEEMLFQALAEECAESRFEGGVHFRTDNEVGLEVGEKVGNQVIKVFSRLKK